MYVYTYTYSVARYTMRAMLFYQASARETTYPPTSRIGPFVPSPSCWSFESAGPLAARPFGRLSLAAHERVEVWQSMSGSQEVFKVRRSGGRSCALICTFGLVKKE